MNKPLTALNAHKGSFCEWCQVAPWEMEYVFSEPVQLNLFHMVVMALWVCSRCVEDVKTAEEYALYS